MDIDVPSYESQLKKKTAICKLYLLTFGKHMTTHISKRTIFDKIMLRLCLYVLINIVNNEYIWYVYVCIYIYIYIYDISIHLHIYMCIHIYKYIY